MSLLDRQLKFAGYLVAGFQELGLHGWDLAGAACATGNATQENLVKAVTTGPKDHGSDGTMQWRNDNSRPPPATGRLTDMQTWCVKHFGRWDTLQAQAAFTLYETKRDYSVPRFGYPALHSEMLKSMDGVGVGFQETDRQRVIRKVLDYKTEMFCFVFERPNRAKAGLLNRQRHAASVYMIMAGSKPPVVLPKPKAPPIVTNGGIVIAGGSTAGGVMIALENGATDTMSLALFGVSMIIAAGVMYLGQPKTAEPIVRGETTMTPLERLTEALEQLTIAKAQVAEAADALKESVDESNIVLAAADETFITIENEPAPRAPQLGEHK